MIITVSHRSCHWYVDDYQWFMILFKLYTDICMSAQMLRMYAVCVTGTSLLLLVSKSVFRVTCHPTCLLPIILVNQVHFTHHLWELQRWHCFIRIKSCLHGMPMSSAISFGRSAFEFILNIFFLSEKDITFVLISSRCFRLFGCCAAVL